MRETPKRPACTAERSGNLFEQPTAAECTEIPYQAQSREMLAHALRCAADGLPVIPVHVPQGRGCSCGRPECDKPGKHPRITGWTREASTDVATIRRWWQQWPRANLGVLTGGRSGALVIDVDGPEGEAALARLETEHGRLPDTRTARTGGGGLHLHFALPPDVSIPTSAGTLAPHVDVRGDGGLIVLPPSLHASGRRYRWIEADAPLAALPTAWLRLLARRPRPTGPRETPAVIPEGGRNARLAAEAGALRRRGWDADEIESALATFNASRCSPPLDAAEVREIAVSICRYEPTSVLIEAQATAELARLRAENAMLRAGISGRDGIRRNRGLGNSRDTAAAVLIEASTAHATGRVDNDGFFPVAVGARAADHPAVETLADLAGRSPDTVTRDLQLLQRAGIVRLRRETTFARRIDTATGEIVTGPRSMLSLRLLVPLDQLASRLATADLRGVGRKTKTPAVCPACGADAGVTITRTAVCDGCGHAVPLPDLHKQPQPADSSPEPPATARRRAIPKEPQVAAVIRSQGTGSNGKEPQLAVPLRAARPVAPAGRPPPWEAAR